MRKSDDLEKLIKEKMGYMEEPSPKCRNCNFSLEIENHYVDRMWDWICKRNIDIPITIKPESRCNHYEKT